MYLVYAGCGIWLARVASTFSRDGSTVAHACHQIEDRHDDPQFDLWVDVLEATLLQAVSLPGKPALVARQLKGG